jgi:hypothetical protein
VQAPGCQGARDRDFVESREVAPKSEFIFLDALRSDRPLCLAVEAAISADPAFDVAEVLHRYVMAQIIVDFHPAGTATEKSSGAAHDA